GIRIEIDLGSLRLTEPDRRCRWHCAVGKIRYDDVDETAIPGVLIYLKPSLTGEEPADVLDYARRCPAFPHESTLNQFFTESQFEGYRALGQHTAEAVFEESLPDLRAGDGRRPLETPAERHARRCRDFFSSISRRWFAMPPKYESTFLESTRNFAEIQQ